MSRDRVVRHGHRPQGAIQTGVGLLRSGSPRCATGRTRARERKSTSPRRSCRNRLDQGPLPVLLLPWVPTADFQEALAARLGKAPSISGVMARLTAGWRANYDALQKRDLSARRYVYVWGRGSTLQARMKRAQMSSRPGCGRERRARASS
jgi:putative transposase